MKIIRWSQEKNRQIQKQKGLTFEMVLVAIDKGGILEDLIHPNLTKYSNQRIVIVKIGDYAYLVPYLDSSSEIFLKTIIPSKKATTKYILSTKNHE